MKRFSNLMAAMATVGLTGIAVIGCVGNSAPASGGESAEGGLSQEVRSEPFAFALSSDDESAGPELLNRQARDAPDQASLACPVDKACTFCGPQTFACYLDDEGTRYSGTVKLENGSCICSSSTTWWDWSCDVTCL